MMTGPYLTEFEELHAVPLSEMRPDTSNAEALKAMEADALADAQRNASGLAGEMVHVVDVEDAKVFEERDVRWQRKRPDAEDWRRYMKNVEKDEPIDDDAPAPDDAGLTLTGEQHLAHLDLQRAARAAQQAQQSFASAQAELKAAMDRWLKANAT